MYRYIICIKTLYQLNVLTTKFLIWFTNGEGEKYFSNTDDILPSMLNIIYNMRGIQRMMFSQTSKTKCFWNIK